MSKRYPAEVRGRALAYALEHLDEYPSVYAAAQAIGPTMSVHPASLRQWILAARGPEDESEELAGLRRENRELRHANAILKLASAYFAQEMVSESVCPAVFDPLGERVELVDEDTVEEGREE
ncbi:transposase [Nocardia sp. NPDC059239]|uniref:transposase n=1 Tax=unclassified Nocardia TaxID=2637762 RepID=UPI0036BBA7FD